MSNACTLILVGEAFPVLEIRINSFQIWPNFSFGPWTLYGDYFIKM